MVEGHSVHRLASSFRSRLVGRRFAASSPNGRFVDGAAAIDGRALYRMEAVGKNLFAFFRGHGGTDDEDAVVHVHFGMSGAWSVSTAAEEPETKPTTRLRLEEIVATAADGESGRARASTHAKLVAHLSAMTVTHGGLSLYLAKKSSLGQDPLRSDADPDALYEKITKSKKSIGQLLMDQSCFAGPGNIYRAEILFLAGVYPTTPGNALGRATFDRVWNAAVKLLRRGYDTGSILTVDANVDPTVAARGERRYIYNRSRCARCGGRVGSWDMAGRTCYACEGGCQPRIKLEAASTMAEDGNVLLDKNSAEKEVERDEPEAGAKEEGGKQPRKQRQHVPFISHCARVPHLQRLEEGGPERLTIAEIRSVMETMLVNGRPSDNSAAAAALPPKSARKADHVEALRNLLLVWGSAAIKDEGSAALTPLPPPAVSAEDAAREKALSGENRAVEHVAELSREQAVKAVASAVTPSPEVVGKKASKKRGSDREAKAGRRISRRSNAGRRLSYDE